MWIEVDTHASKQGLIQFNAKQYESENYERTISQILHHQSELREHS
jgi:hypothetical protein